MDTYDILAGTV